MSSTNVLYFKALRISLAFSLRYAEWREFLRLKKLAFPPLALPSDSSRARSSLRYSATMTCFRFLVRAGMIAKTEMNHRETLRDGTVVRHRRVKVGDFA